MKALPKTLKKAKTFKILISKFCIGMKFQFKNAALKNYSATEDNSGKIV